MTTDDLSAPLAAIGDALLRLGRRVLLQSLQPGLPGARAHEAFGQVGLNPPPELVTLYGWRNGTSTERVSLDDIHLFPGFYLLSVDDAVANYQAFVTDSRWRTGWLPVLANGGGDFYVVDLSSSASSPVRHFRIDELEHPIEFSSLSSLLETLAEAFERGVFFVDPGGYLEMSDRAFGDLAAELNPDVDWWRD